MKFLRFLCNLGLFIVLAMGISSIQVGVYDVFAAQSSNVTAIHMAAPSDTSVAYLDSFTFLVDDISTNLKQPPKYRIRNLVAGDWWKNGMAWADTGLEFIFAVTKPILVPLAQVNAIRVYHAKTIENFYETLLNNNYGGNIEALNNALFEEYVIFSEFSNANGPCTVVQIELNEDETVARIIGSEISISEYAEIYSGKYLVDGQIQYNQSKSDFARWVKENRDLYNHNWKLNKYNSEVYAQYFRKFINESESGERNIKPAAVMLYYQQTVSIILALIFVIKYPIALFQGRYVGKGDKEKVA